MIDPTNERDRDFADANRNFAEYCRPSFRYAVIDANMVVERIEEGTIGGPMDPHKIYVDSDIAYEGMFYDPIKERFSMDRDPNAIASYKDLLQLRAEEKLKIWIDKRRIRLVKDRETIMYYLQQVDQELSKYE